MKVQLTAEKPYIKNVALMISEVLPAVLDWHGGEKDDLARMMLQSRLADLEHACRIAREQL